ncbi:mechanosensitive ion channel family protein [Serpentinicella alkaliphila]|uniref:Small conductance mechanosensitive channel n=1 Tax=Serpentinicella alkaliphila TaxID=1734049 RepID=A0A4R2TH82_9FIRM|nr:mechanosensitive ion channel family protein [Serpentinicella alkaliphila]QUH25385.1 mechanosensitive ion channel family protein [Serpentinicella alkaliphila]TCQ01562.1 small conductance mechanosensitive channel [Serpentinicella alkaliphila]
MESVLESLRLIFFHDVVSKLIRIIVILAVAKISIRLINPVLIQFFEKQKTLKINTDINRINTLKGLVLSLVKYVIYFIAFTTIAKLFVDITGLVATAGIGGLAIGFGAQNLVRDIITGFFILFEEQFNVGSLIQLDGIGGIVEEMALRVTKIRDFNGDLHIIPNGEIKKVTNKSNGKMRALVEISISYEEDIDNAIEVLSEACEKIKEENPNSILEGPTVLGVSKLGESEVGITIMAKTVPMEQWATERLMRKTFKQAFDKAGIEIPYPRRVIINKMEA